MVCVKSDFPILPCRNCFYYLSGADGCCEECRDFCPYFAAMKWVRCPLRPRTEMCTRKGCCVNDIELDFDIIAGWRPPRRRR